MIVYLAGGINGLSDSDANDWRAEAKHLIPREIGVLDPMSRDYRGIEDDNNVQEIVEGDLADIEQCDAVIAYCPRPSWGTAMEIHHVATRARSKGDRVRRVYAVVPEGQAVSPWLRHYTDAVVPTIADAVALLRESL